MKDLKLENLESLRGICKKDDMIESIIDLIDDGEAISDSTIKLVTVVVICQTFGNDKVKELLSKDSIRDDIDKYLEPLFAEYIKDDFLFGEDMFYITNCVKDIVAKKEKNYYSLGKSLERIIEKVSTFDYAGLGEFIKENKSLIGSIGANKNIDIDKVLGSIADITKQD